MFYFVLAVVVEAVMAHISSCFWISPFPQIQCLLLRHSVSALQSRSPEWFLYEVFKSNSQIKNLGPGGWRGIESQEGSFPCRWRCPRSQESNQWVCAVSGIKESLRNLKCHIGDLYEPPAYLQRCQTTVTFSSLLLLNIQGTCLIWDFLVSWYL